MGGLLFLGFRKIFKKTLKGFQVLSLRKNNSHVISTHIDC